MSITSLTYMPPIRRDAVGRELDYDLLETAAEQYGAGEHLASAQTVFRHLFGAADAPDLSRPFSFTQGSSRLTVRIDDGVCFLSVPMVRLPAGGGGVAALRYILSRINASGQLAQARLRGDEVSLEYSDKLSALHPQKLIEVLRRMPVEADRHDDWMESQFGVTPLERGTIEPLDPAELERAAQIWQTHWNDVDELLKEAQRKRSQFFLNEVTAFAIHRIRFALPLAGSLLPRLLESSRTFNDSDADPRKRETTLARFLKEMKAVSSEDLGRSLGHVEHSITPHSEGTGERLGNFFGPGNYVDTIARFRKAGQAMEATLPLVGTYYYLLATHAWPAEIAEAMKQGLAASSGKPWRDAATLMLEHARAMVERFAEDDDEDDDAAAADDNQEGV